MENQTLELILWMLLVFFIGCILGYLFRKLTTQHYSARGKSQMNDFGWQCSPVERAGSVAPPYKDAAMPRAAAQPAPLAQPVAPKPAPMEVKPRAAKPAAAVTPAAAIKPKAAAKPDKAVKPAVTGKPSRPQGLAAARGGKADNLQRISGVGPKLEKTLHSLGFFHFDQIAAWSKDEEDWVDEHLRFKGRIERDDWIRQAKSLDEGG